MLRTLPVTRDYRWAQRLAVIVAFTLLTALSAQIKFYFGSPVPVTLQVLVVLLAGMVLGARDGALSQVFYVGLLALNLPLDSAGAGVGALTGATAGYIIGFIPAAAVVGLLVERGADRVWQRWLSGIAGTVVIYLCGATWLQSVTGMEWSAVWAAGIAPFIVIDLIKAMIAAGLSEGGRAALLRRFLPLS